MNLDVKNSSNGDPIPRAKTAEEWSKAAEDKTPAWCYRENDPSTTDKYGILECHGLITEREVQCEILTRIIHDYRDK